MSRHRKIENPPTKKEPNIPLAILLTAILLAAPALAAAGTPANLPDGQPDVQGFWRVERGGTYSLTNPDFVGLNQAVRDRELKAKGQPLPTAPSRIADPVDGQVPYQSWARTRQQQIQANLGYPTQQQHLDPLARCFQVGVVRTLMASEFELQQFPGYVVILFGANHIYRVIPIDGHAHAPSALKLWMSDSRGRWDGQTLVVDVTNSNAKGRLDIAGDFFSDQARMTERFGFSTPGVIDYRVTITDPTVFTRPWTIAARILRAHADESSYEQWEESCHEGEKNSDDSLLTPARAAQLRRQAQITSAPQARRP
jgi:hypothetical protein